MQEKADMELLWEYVRRNSEDAFATLVARHVNMVYSAAVRKTGNPSAAEEISQAVFIILAKKADRLHDGTILSGWLYQTARLTSASFLRTEIRRARREQEAYMQSLSNEPEAKTWLEIEPLLEDAVGRLGEKERNAIALRFFEGKSFQEIGMAVGASENAAKKRVSHALEKLRKFFAKRGVVSTATLIASAISANSVQAAPAVLAKSITAVAVAKGAAASGSTLTLIKGALKLMAWTKTKTAVVVGVIAVLTTATTTVTVILNNTDSARANARIARAKRGIPTDPNAIARAAANAKVLVFRNIRSWNRHPDFEEALTAMSFEFDVKPSSQMENTDLSAYDLVIIPGAQWETGFYRDYAKNATFFENYVSRGGTLLFELNGAEGRGMTIPGGVNMVPHGAKDNQLIFPEHPILIPMEGKPIHASYASHGYLVGTPKNAIVLATEMDQGKSVLTRPTFIEYPYGSGRIIAACQCFHDQDGSGRGALMQSAIGYTTVKKWFSSK